MNEQQKQTLEALRQRDPKKWEMMQEIELRVLKRCKEIPQRVSELQLRQLIREEWEKMKQESNSNSHPQEQ